MVHMVAAVTMRQIVAIATKAVSCLVPAVLTSMLLVDMVVRLAQEMLHRLLRMDRPLLGSLLQGHVLCMVAPRVLWCLMAASATRDAKTLGIVAPITRPHVSSKRHQAMQWPKVGR